MKKTITIEFDNEIIAHHFAIWMTECGEQDYHNYMEYREEEEDGNITAVDFNYWGELDETKSEDDEKRYGEFLCDGIIRTSSGRLDRND